MRYTTKTEYGLVCLIYMARNGNRAAHVTIKEIAQKEKYPTAYIEKIVQAFRQAGIVDSHAGKRGGYSLAKPASELTLKQIIEALEGSTFEVFCSPKVREDIVCTHLCLCGVKPVWRHTKEILDNFYESVTLEMLASEKPGAWNLETQGTKQRNGL